MAVNIGTVGRWGMLDRLRWTYATGHLCQSGKMVYGSDGRASLVAWDHVRIRTS